MKEFPLLTLTLDLDRPAAMNSLIRDRGNEVTQRSERRGREADAVIAPDLALLDPLENIDPMESTGITGTGTETTGITGRGTTGITETVVGITASAMTEIAEEADPVSAALAEAGVQGASVEGE